MPLKSYKMHFFTCCLLAGSVLLSSAHASQRQPAASGTDVVTSAADDGTAGTLRSVLAAAAPGDTVTFAPAVFSVPQTISLSGSELDISRSVTIQGPGANRLTIDAQSASYVFNISGGTVALSGMTVAHGAGANRYGGIVNAGTLTLTNVTVTASTGSGIGNTGSLTASGCTFSGNNNVGGNYNGGGLYNSGTASLTNCTFANNAAYEGGAVVSGINIGGMTRSGSLVLTNCTFASNSAQLGGAVYDIATLTATSCTFTGNSGLQHGCGGLLVNGTATVTGCLFTGSTGGDIVLSGGGTATSGGSNLLGDAAANNDFSTAGQNDQFGVSTAQAAVGPLASNGGATQTCALLSGSSAIDADYNSGSTVDQRGILRPQGVRNDIGAYEAGPIAYTLWNSPDGQVQVRAVTYTGSQTTLGTFGPYTDSTDQGVPGNTALWKAIAIAHVPDGTLRLLWQHPDGRVMLWRLSGSGAMLSVTGYGPYTDAGDQGVAGNTAVWKAVGLSVSADGLTHLVWDHPDGRAMLWNVNADDTFAVIGGYGPYTDSSDQGVAGNTALWKAVAVQVRADGNDFLLWDHPDGRVMLWTVDGSYNIAGLTGYGLYTDAPISSSLWQALGLAVTPANLPYVLWSNPDNRSVLWNVTTNGSVNYSGVFEASSDSAGQPWQPNAVSGL